MSISDNAGIPGGQPAEAFAILDTNGDQKVTRAEAEAHGADFDQLLLLDKNNDGKIDIGEFMALYEEAAESGYDPLPSFDDINKRGNRIEKEEYEAYLKENPDLNLPTWDEYLSLSTSSNDTVNRYEHSLAKDADIAGRVEANSANQREVQRQLEQDNLEEQERIRLEEELLALKLEVVKMMVEVIVDDIGDNINDIAGNGQSIGRSSSGIQGASANAGA